MNGAPSPWIQRWAPVLPEGARVVDVACGSGRHVRYLADRGCTVTAVDRNSEALTGLADCAETVVADLEGGPWPLIGRTFDAIVMTHYLWRPLWPALRRSLAPGGWMLIETFAWGNGRWGRPSNPLFLLQPGELLRLCEGLHVLAYEDGLLEAPTRRIQRIVAQRPSSPNLHRQGDLPLVAHQ